MSNNSLKRSLELLEGSSASLKSAKSTKKSKNPFMREPSPPKVTLSNIIKSKRKSKKIQHQSTQPSQHKKSSTLQNKVKEKSSKAEENLRKLLMLSSPVNLDNETTQKLIKRAQTQKYVIPEPKSKDVQETVFTNEDFLKFEREYFCS